MKNNWKRIINCIKVLLVFSVFVCLLFWGGNKLQQVEAEDKKIKVGFIGDMESATVDAQNYQGYAVEYLDAISELTGWEYEFVYDTWDNCMAMTISGDIDLICMTQYTDVRANYLLYADVPFGYEYAVAYVPADADIYYQDYAAMQGKTAGLMTASVHSESFLERIEEIDLDISVQYFDTEQEIIDAMEEGLIEIAVVGSLYNHKGLKVVDSFDAKPYYCVTGKMNADFMEELDKALHQLKIMEPELEASLNEKYYGTGTVSSSPMFTREEAEFIQNAEPVCVKLMVGSKPLSYLNDDKEVSGIFSEYLKVLSRKSGLEFYVDLATTSADMEEQTENMVEGNYLMLRAESAINRNGLSEELIHSTPLLNTQLTYVKNKNKILETDRTDYIFAITKEMQYLPELLYRDMPDCEILFYDTPSECLEAVIAGAADVAIQDSYMVAYLLQKPRYEDNLVEYPGDEYVNGMCLIAGKDQEILISIIDKTIAYISDAEKESIVSMELITHPYKQSFSDFLYRYGSWLLVAVMAILASVFLYTYLMRRLTDLQIKRKEYELLRKKVQQDELTGVYNRTYFFEEARKMIDASNEEMCIVIVDISNFKVVNDLYGMDTGDKLLCYMADELKEMGEGRQYIVARFSGDHFYICLSKRDFEEISFPKRYKTFLEEMDITVTYGVFPVEEQRDVPINLMCDRASLAVHNIEKSRTEYIRFYSEEDRQRIVHEREIENDMEKALESRQFCVYIQPKYDINKEEIIGGEALVRWVHPEKGMIPPYKFISIFEKNGFIIRLDYFVWEETCRFIQKMKRCGIHVPISVNVSRAHFYGKELRDKLEELIAKYQLEPSDFELEVTETICAEDPDIIYKRIKELRKDGFKVAMDDFGSGYSSLNMLKEAPLDIIKMDLKFLDGGEDVKKGRYILKSLIKLAKNMGLYVVVEGVETLEQVEFLKETDSSCAQGYYYSKPVDIVTYENLIKQKKENLS